MDGEEFYENFKWALDAFGVRWADKENVKVLLRSEGIMYVYGDKAIFIKLPEDI